MARRGAVFAVRQDAIEIPGGWPQCRRAGLAVSAGVAQVAAVIVDPTALKQAAAEVAG